MTSTDEDTRIKILIIDDEPSFYDSFCDFTEEGWNIEICETKKPSINEVKNSIKNHQISAVISDLKFSANFNFDKGIEFVKELCSEIEIPVIVITNDDRFLTRARVLELGASGFFEKSSFNREDVKIGIEQIIQDYSKASMPFDDLSLLIEYFLADSNVCPPQYKQFWNKKLEEVLENDVIEKIEKYDWRNDIIGFKNIFRRALLKVASCGESKISANLICNSYQKKKKISRKKQTRKELEHVEHLLNHHSRNRKTVEQKLGIERGSLPEYIKERHLTVPSVFDKSLSTILDVFNISWKIQQKIDIVFWCDESDTILANSFLNQFEIIKKGYPIQLFVYPRDVPLDENRLDYLLEYTRKASITFLFLSPEALNNYEFSELLSIIYSSNKATKHIPIIARTCNWNKTQLAGQIALPKDVSSISNSENSEDTMIEIVEALEKYFIDKYVNSIE